MTKEGVATIRIVAFVVAFVTLAACSPSGPPADFASLKPSESRLAALYEQSCKACHTNRNSGAPLVHDHAAWDPRWDKGLDVLTQHAIAGFGAMPAGGQCAACKLDDYRRLIRFMADREKEQ